MPRSGRACVVTMATADGRTIVTISSVRCTFAGPVTMRAIAPCEASDAASACAASGSGSSGAANTSTIRRMRLGWFRGGPPAATIASSLACVYSRSATSVALASTTSGTSPGPASTVRSARRSSAGSTRSDHHAAGSPPVGMRSSRSHARWS